MYSERAVITLLFAGFLALSNTVAAQLVNRTDPLPGIVSSAQPDAAALESIAKEGFAAVIDLRGAQEERGIDEQKVVESLGMRYVSLPLVGTEAINYENAKVLDEILEAIDGPVLLHCASGNRVGGILALRERLNGASAEEAYATGIAGGLASPALKEAVKSQLEDR